MKEILLVISLLLNVYIVFMVRSVHSASTQSNSEVSAALDRIAKQTTPVIPGQPDAASPAMSDADIAAIAKRVINEELPAISASLKGSSDGQGDAGKLRQLQDKIDEFQRKYSDKLTGKDQVLAEECLTRDQIMKMAAQVRTDVLNQCQK